MKYDFTDIEKKWQKRWDEEKTFAARLDKSKKKYYALVEFPYPSGQGLHIGHPRPYTAMDIVARKRRMQGYSVLFPIGWDAFGLPTENYAIKNHIHPAIVTERNIARFTEQLKSLGLRLGQNNKYDRSRLFQMDAVDLPQALREGTCIQEGNERKLLHLMQGRSCKRGGRKRRLRALRK